MITTEDILVGKTPVSAPTKDARRRVVVLGVFFVFILSLLEGPLRKWFIPSLATPLIFLRDPFVIVLYFYAFINGIYCRSTLSAVVFGFAAVSFALGLLQYIYNGHGIEGLVLGVRTYWLYMPLAFIVGGAFDVRDVLRFFITILLFSIPYAALVSIQYSSPPHALVNLGVAGDADAAVGLGDGIVRPFGLFTYIYPSTLYTIFSLSVLLAFFFRPKAFGQHSLIGIIAIFSIASMGVLTGSRYVIFAVGSVLLYVVFSLVFSRPSKRYFVFIAFISFFLIFSLCVLFFVFPDMKVAMMARFERAAYSEGHIGNRIYYSAFSFLDAFLDASFFGYGIGAGAPGVSRYLGLPPLFLGESDTQRNVRELGILLGGAFLLIRWLVAAYALRMAYLLAAKGNAMMLPLAGFAAFQISVGQLTNSPISAFLPWLSLGLVIAAFRGR